MQDVVTRWNSTFDMLSRLHKLRNAVVLFASSEGIEDCGMQWALIPKIINVLQPFKEATVKVRNLFSIAYFMIIVSFSAQFVEITFFLGSSSSSEDEASVTSSDIGKVKISQNIL